MTDVIVPFTRMVVVLPVVEFLEKLGAPLDTYMSKVGLPGSLLESPEAPVPTYLASRFIELAAQREGIEELGLVAGNQVNVMTDFGDFSEYLRRTVTCADYLDRGSQALGMLSRGTRMWLSRDHAGCWFNIKQKGAGTDLGTNAELYPMVVTIATLRAMSGAGWQPDTIRLPPWCKVGRSGRNILKDASIELTDGSVSFRIPDNILAAKNPLNDASRSTPRGAPRWPLSIREEIASVAELLILDRRCKIELAAEAAGLSPRTLQRRLSEAGTSFSEIVADRRIEMATRLLLETDLPIVTIAQTLGYTDSSNFTRAFRSHTGCSPTVFRKVNLRSIGYQ